MVTGYVELVTYRSRIGSGVSILANAERNHGRLGEKGEEDPSSQPPHSHLLTGAPSAYVGGMLISQKIIDAINEQIGMEFGASMQYEAISSHFVYEALPGLAGHFAKQAEEERDHAHRFMKFVHDAGGRVEIPGIDKPASAFAFAKDAVRISLDHELKVTAAINALMRLAVEEEDHITQNMLQWFLREQVEEVSSMDELLKIVERAGETNLLLVEQYLSGGIRRMPYSGAGESAE